jgi:excisionase family DNA binding protein
MTVDQVAHFLQVSRRTIYAMALAGTLPAAKVGDRWRFYRPEIERWLTQLSRANIGDTSPVDPESPAPTVKL